MKILLVLLLAASVRTCTKESSTFEQKQVPDETVVTKAPDPVTVTVLGIYEDDLKTRGATSEERSRINGFTVAEGFSDLFNYPQSALESRLEGSCTVQFAIDSANTIQYFSVLRTDSKIFSDDVRRVIASSPIPVTPFPGSHILRFEVKVDYSLKGTSKM